jgi:hypothetical protein
MSKRSLKAAIEAGEFVIAPGLHDMIAAVVCNKVGFDFVMIEVIELGAFGAHVCQALKIPAACDWRNFQETPNTRTFVRAKMRNTNCVAIPKLPPPPPLHAQNKSGSELTVACSVLPWQSIMVTC